MFFSYITLGCKVNQIENEQIAKELTALGYFYTKDLNRSDFLVINTCTVTHKADRKSWHIISKCNRQKNLTKIFITGCYSELAKDLAGKLSSKNVIVSQREKSRLPKIIDEVLRKQIGYSKRVPDYKDKWEAFKNSRVFTYSLNNDQSNFFNHQRAFLKIQDGCNAFCTYCRIPFARGAPISRDALDILAQVRELEKKNQSEIVLTGINIGTYYDKKNKLTFGGLVKEILASCRFAKVRISSLEPQSIKEDFLKCLGHENLVPHLHLPLQGLSDRILALMKRRYRLKDFENLLRRFRGVDAHFSVSTDVIVGFPDEEESEFEQGVEFVKKCDFTKIHVFPFSFRPLSKLDDKKKVGECVALDAQVVKRRVALLNELSQQLTLKQARGLRKVKQRMVLEEKINPLAKREYQKTVPFEFSLENYDFFKGTTDYYVKGLIPLPKGAYEIGQTSEVLIKSLDPIIFEEPLSTRRK